MFITVMSKIIYNISLEHGVIHRGWSSKTVFCRKIIHRCFFLMLKDVYPQCYVQNVWSAKWRIVPTSPPVASTEPSWLNAKANCCPTCCNWVSGLSECFTPSLWTPSLLSFSQSNHLDKKCTHIKNKINMYKSILLLMMHEPKLLQQVEFGFKMNKRTCSFQKRRKWDRDQQGEPSFYKANQRLCPA